MHYPHIPWWQRIIQRLAMIDLISTGFLAKYLHRMDTTVLKWSKGGKSMTTMLAGLPVIVLFTTGARSGKSRTIPVAGIPDGEKIILVPSSFGSRKYPGWYYNLRAFPEVELSLKGHKKYYVARIADPEERLDYWQLALHYYPGYQLYEERSDGRKIPLFILEPIE
jgi:deazaflavin-dependent oxidoreductase (nitroreductase family)